MYIRPSKSANTNITELSVGTALTTIENRAEQRLGGGVRSRALQTRIGRKA